MSDREDHLHAATFTVTLQPGASLTIVASTEPDPVLDGASALNTVQTRDRQLLNLWRENCPASEPHRSAWIDNLVLAADQFIVAPLLNLEQQQAVVDTCGRMLLTSHGWRSL